MIRLMPGLAGRPAALGDGRQAANCNAIVTHQK